MAAVARYKGGRSAVAGERSDVFWMVTMNVVTAMMPIQFELAGQMLSPNRIFLLIVTPYLLACWISGKYGRLVYADYAVTFFCLWMTLSVAYHEGAGRAFSFAGSNVLLIMGGYLVSRAAIRSSADFIALVKLMAFITILILPLAIRETFFLTESFILRSLAKFPFLIPYPGGGVQLRFGLDRAQVVFTHAIHYGIFCSLSIAPFYLGLMNHLTFTARVGGAFLIVLATFCSLSSGPLATTALQLALIFYTVVLYGASWQWAFAKWGGLVVYVILELATTKPAFFRMAEMLAYSAHNAYTRQIMVEAGQKLMAAYPLFGYGLRAWPLPYWMRYSSSIDNYWLVIGGTFGIPALVSLMSVIIVPMFTLGGKRLTKGSDLYWARVSWTIMGMGLLLVLATVHVWGPLTAIIYMMVGAGMFLAHAVEPEAKATGVADVASAPSRGPVYTRFPAHRGLPAPPVASRSL